MLAYVFLHQPENHSPKKFSLVHTCKKILMNPLSPCTPPVAVLATYFPLVHLKIKQTPRPLPPPQTPLLQPPTLCRTTTHNHLNRHGKQLPTHVVGIPLLPHLHPIATLLPLLTKWKIFTLVSTYWPTDTIPHPNTKSQRNTTFQSPKHNKASAAPLIVSTPNYCLTPTPSTTLPHTVFTPFSTTPTANHIHVQNSFEILYPDDSTIEKAC